MKLYHYSKERYNVLKSRRAQGLCTPEDIKEAEDYSKEYSSFAPYIDSISLFFDPVPLVLLSKIYKPTHHTWVKGNKLFEYTVESRNLETAIKYYATETPADLKEIDKIDWKKWNNDEEFVKAYFKDKIKRKLNSGEAGRGLVGLGKQIQAYQGTTEQFFLAASKRADFKDHQEKYAACVPHLMIYPSLGTVAVESVRSVVVGYER